MIKAILDALDVSQDSNLSFVFVTHQKIRALHKKYLNSDCATDVITFDLKEMSSVKKQKVLIGEIIVSTDEAKKNSKIYNTDYEEELALYCIHGILHLCGFDDHAPKDIKVMRAQESKVLAIVSKQIKGIVA